VARVEDLATGAVAFEAEAGGADRAASVGFGAVLIGGALHGWRGRWGFLRVAVLLAVGTFALTVGIRVAFVLAVGP